jgi:hypothetical protein
MFQNPDPHPRKVRRFLPQLIETCSRKVGGLRSGPNTADIRILRGKAAPHSHTKDRASTQVHPPLKDLSPAGGLEPELAEGLSSASGQSHLKRPRGSENYEPIGQEQPEIPSLEQGGTMTVDKQRAGPGQGASRGEEGPMPSQKPQPSSPRRFTPEVIETGKRSFRRGESEDGLHDSNTLANQPAHSKATASSAGKWPSGTGPDPVTATAASLSESRFSFSGLVQRQDQPRRRSFRVPDLPTIPSPWNEGSEVEPSSAITSSSESLAGSPKPQPAINQHREYRESCDESQARYLLSLAARSAEEQLKERALAVFPNEQDHQPVDHFAIEEDEVSVHEKSVDESEYIKHRRASSADLTWALEHMRLHKEEAEVRNRAMVGINELQDDSAAAALHEVLQNGSRVPDSELLSDTVEDTDPAQPERPISPPMLGDDLIFPQSVSPEGTLYNFPVSSQKRQDEACEVHGGLWCGGFRGDRNGGGDGLWMGTCKPAEKDSAGLHQGPAEASLLTGEPAAVNGDADADNERRKRLREVSSNEFHDGFVTQIYNYLSLGYPCIARYFDYELSEVSGIPIAELRKDDLRADAKGFTGVTQGPVNDANGAEGCMRWAALRLYIHKFAKQQQQQQQPPPPKAIESAPTIETWGVPERKGSWAG